jgi:protein-S-isoprenylcysteine O-methyltransferase Ste14
MTDALRLILPFYFLLYFGVAFVFKSIMVARRIGKSPLVLPDDDSAYGLIGRYFKVVLIGLLLYVLVYAFFPTIYPSFLPIRILEASAVQYAGLSIMLIALVWTVVAQNHMRDSWRIGIDSNAKTALVTNGLFAHSRNPIFLGMALVLLGLMLVTPNAVTAGFLVIGFMLMQIQIRLEEDHMVTIHGSGYMQYRQRVRRWI